MIKVDNVWHTYSVKPVLKGINLHIKAGELVTVMGPNGMGKSTLLALIGGMMKPTRGQIIIDAKVRRSAIAAEKEIRKIVFYLPADPYLPLGLTGREYILGIGRLWGRDDMAMIPHMESLLDIFDLKDQGDSLIHSYSTGQRKKIGLCAAFITETPVMVLDEPLSGGLDSSALVAVTRILRRLAERKESTVVIAVPVPELVEELSGRIAVIQSGKMLTCGTLQELREQSQCNGSLAEILEKIGNPQALDKVETYLKERLS